MSDQAHNHDFDEMLYQIQMGDDRAVASFVAEYEPYIRRAIRFRIKNAALMAAADSVDVCQSVLGGFLLKLSAGDYRLESEEQLRGLLLSIAKKKFSMLYRREHAIKRSRNHTRSLEDIPEVPSLSEQLVTFNLDLSELSSQVRERLNDDEWSLLELRRQGQSWKEIEARLNVSSLVLKKRLSRALRRVAEELGIDL